MKKYNMIPLYLKLSEIRDVFLIPSYLDSWNTWVSHDVKLSDIRYLLNF